jgi:hypothetical protein
MSSRSAAALLVLVVLSPAACAGRRVHNKKKSSGNGFKRVFDRQQGDLWWSLCRGSRRTSGSGSSPAT